MPELPEVESARAVIARAGLDRLIVDVDDTDSYVCRPHPPGQIRAALLGTRLTAAHRRGKSIWCETGGPVLGIHLGMSGKIVIAGPDGSEIDGGDYWEGRRVAGDFRWQRLASPSTTAGVSCSSTPGASGGSASIPRSRPSARTRRPSPRPLSGRSWPRAPHRSRPG